jgi:hypothetical protein
MTLHPAKTSNDRYSEWSKFVIAEAPPMRRG